MFITDTEYLKITKTMTNLEKYLGEEINIIFSTNDYYNLTATLKSITPFEHLTITCQNQDITINFLSLTSMIWQISSQGAVLYDNKDNILTYLVDKIDYKTLETKTFGETYLNLRNYYNLQKSSSSNNNLYSSILKGLPLVKEELQIDWLKFVTHYYQIVNNDQIMDLVLNLLASLKKRTSYELIYQNYLEVSSVNSIYLTIALDIVSYFTNGGKFLKDYFTKKLKNQGLNLTLTNNPLQN